MSQSEWVWMPHAGHLIISHDCRFHLATAVAGGKFVVSTVGEYLPDSNVRDVLARCRGITLEGTGDMRRASWMRQVGYEDVGLDRKYETMVFTAMRNTEHRCCPFTQANGIDLEFRGYNEPGDAYEGHLEMCREWEGK